MNQSMNMKIRKFKLIKDFPNMESYNIKAIGDIFTDDGYNAVRDQNNRAIFAIEFDKYPHLFEEII